MFFLSSLSLSINIYSCALGLYESRSEVIATQQLLGRCLKRTDCPRMLTSDFPRMLNRASETVRLDTPRIPDEFPILMVHVRKQLSLVHDDAWCTCYQRRANQLLESDRLGRRHGGRRKKGTYIQWGQFSRHWIRLTRRAKKIKQIYNISDWSDRKGAMLHCEQARSAW